MKAIALLIFIFSNDGRWLSGTDGSVTVQWAAPAAAVPCELHWEIKLKDVKLAEGKTAVGVDESPIVKITCPEVRARLTLKWEWKLVRKSDSKQLDGGSQNIIAYPSDITSPWPEMLAKRSIVVIDRHRELPTLLETAKVKFTRVDDVSKLQMIAADTVIVGPDMFLENQNDQLWVSNLWKAGTSVLVLQQSKADKLLGFELAPRTPPEKLTWLGKPSMLRGLDADDLAGLEHTLKSMRPVSLQPNDLAFSDVLGTWPNAKSEEVLAGGRPRPPNSAEKTADGIRPPVTDAMIVFASPNNRHGKLILCQLSLENWQSDPRSQILLGNMLDALVSPAENKLRQNAPTTAPAERGRPKSNILP